MIPPISFAGEIWFFSALLPQHCSGTVQAFSFPALKVQALKPQIGIVTSPTSSYTICQLLTSSFFVHRLIFVLSNFFSLSISGRSNESCLLCYTPLSVYLPQSAGQYQSGCALSFSDLLFWIWETRRICSWGTSKTEVKRWKNLILWSVLYKYAKKSFLGISQRKST